MKKITLFVLLLAIIQIAKAQTVLKPGDIAIVQVNYTFNSFDFVCYVDIEAGTEIWFTNLQQLKQFRQVQLYSTAIFPM